MWPVYHDPEVIMTRSELTMNLILAALFLEPRLLVFIPRWEAGSLHKKSSCAWPRARRRRRIRRDYWAFNASHESFSLPWLWAGPLLPRKSGLHKPNGQKLAVRLRMLAREGSQLDRHRFSVTENFKSALSWSLDDHFACDRNHLLCAANLARFGWKHCDNNYSLFDH